MDSKLVLSSRLRKAVLNNPHPKLADWCSSGDLKRPHTDSMVHGPILRKMSPDMVCAELIRQGLLFREIPENPESLWNEAELLLAGASKETPLPLLLLAPSTFSMIGRSEERRELANAGVFVVREGSAELRSLLTGG